MSSAYSVLRGQSKPKQVEMASNQHEIKFIDTTVRDGNQSLWDATGKSNFDMMVMVFVN